MYAYVYRMDPATNTFDSTSVLEFPLDYDRQFLNDTFDTAQGAATYPQDLEGDGEWLPWNDHFGADFQPTRNDQAGIGTTLMANPQPVLTDIEFSNDGYMYVGFRDRWIDMTFDRDDLGPVVIKEDVTSSLHGIDSYNCGGTEVEREFTILSSFEVFDVNLGLNVSHIWRGDLSATLVSPQSTSVVLFSQNPFDSRDNYDVMLDEDSGNALDDGDNDDVASVFYDRSANPSGNLDSFNGEDAQGTWTLRICDDYGDDNGGFGALTVNRLRLVINDIYGGANNNRGGGDLLLACDSDGDGIFALGERRGMCWT